MAFAEIPKLKEFLDDIGATTAADARPTNSLWNATITAQRRFYPLASWANQAETIHQMIGAVDVQATDLITRATAPANSTGASPTHTVDGPISLKGQQQMAKIVAVAKSIARGRPGHNCYAMVGNYITRATYGNMPKIADVPPAYRALAHQFADYANMPGNCQKLGIRKLNIDDPNAAPAGALVVVSWIAPGIHSHRADHAGDITVAGGNGVFYNGGLMSYGPSSGFPPGNNFCLGIYVPL